ncbi:uncharacterized protein [Elaeis guineensis]|uniref:uncharacterized protein n=1 Tax=Elaeis guineensis var. tenera TaxID=51953 RepID=UPI003C6D759D
MGIWIAVHPRIGFWDSHGFRSRSLFQPNFSDFLNWMRHRASSAYSVRAIKRKLQDFLVTTESAVKEHPLWAHAPDEEIDSVIEAQIPDVPY